MSSRTKAEKAREKYLQRAYGIGLDDYEALLAARGGACWICQKPPKKRRLHVDHDHLTGKVRGLLCWLCNTSLEKYHDRPAILRQAASYLESHKAQDIIERSQSNGITRTS